MCIGKTCGGGSDYCCSNDCLDSGGPRSCGMLILLFMKIFPLKFCIMDKLITNFFSQCMSSLPGGSFYLQEQGIKQCTDGSEVTDANECKEACKRLGIRLSKTFKNGKTCFKAGNGACKQSGTVGAKASLICKPLGKNICLTNLETIFS